MGFRSCFSVPVVAVLLLIGFVYYTVAFLVIDPWLDLTTSPGLLNALLFSLTTLMALSSYGLAILRDPGQIPSSYLPDPEDSEGAIQEVKRKGGEVRYCQKCRVYKPARAHHCRVCKRCVLRMDHHCLWINNCVGHGNYKAFFLFVFYSTLACFHSLILFGGHAMQNLAFAYDLEPVKSSMAMSTIVKVFCSLVLLPLAVALAVLLGWHIFLSLQNKTTIEYYEGVRAKWLAQRAGVSYRHPYDLGPVQNMLMVLGPKASFWCCPMAVGHIGTGLHFEALQESEAMAEAHST